MNATSTSRRLPLLLRAQDDVRQVRGGVRRLPGGFGTLDELFEALTLIQTGKIDRFPIVLMGSASWQGLLDWLHGDALVDQRLGEADLALLTITDDPDEAIAAILDARRG